MRRLLLYLLGVLSTIFIISCTKNNCVSDNGIIGTWELRKDIGGWSGVRTYSPGNGNKLIFTSINFECYQNGLLSETGEYKIFKDSCYTQNKILDRITYISESRTMGFFEKIENNQLVISMDGYDASTYYL